MLGKCPGPRLAPPAQASLGICQRFTPPWPWLWARPPRAAYPRCDARGLSPTLVISRDQVGIVAHAAGGASVAAVGKPPQRPASRAVDAARSESAPGRSAPARPPPPHILWPGLPRPSCAFLGRCDNASESPPPDHLLRPFATSALSIRVSPWLERATAVLGHRAWGAASVRFPSKPNWPVQRTRWLGGQPRGVARLAPAPIE